MVCMSSITFKTETLKNDTLTLVFKVSVPYSQVLAAFSDFDCSDDLLELDFDNVADAFGHSIAARISAELEDES